MVVLEAEIAALAARLVKLDKEYDTYRSETYLRQVTAEIDDFELQLAELERLARLSLEAQLRAAAHFGPP